MEVEELTAIAVFGNRGHKPDLVTDLWLMSKPRQKMRRIFEQEGHAITAPDCARPCFHQIHDFGGSGQWKGDPDAERCLIVPGNRLISEMLTVPVKWPNYLEAVQHIEVVVVPMKGGAYRKLHAVYSDRQLATDLTCTSELVGN